MLLLTHGRRGTARGAARGAAPGEQTQGRNLLRLLAAGQQGSRAVGLQSSKTGAQHTALQDAGKRTMPSRLTHRQAHRLGLREGLRLRLRLRLLLRLRAGERAGDLRGGGVATGNVCCRRSACCRPRKLPSVLRFGSWPKQAAGHSACRLEQYGSQTTHDCPPLPTWKGCETCSPHGLVG